MAIFLIVIFACFGSLATYFLGQRTSASPVRSSALVSLVFGLIHWFFTTHLHFQILAELPAAVMGGSFVGMASVQVLKSWKWVLAAVLIFTFLFLSASAQFQGFGGALGTAASISVMAVMGFPLYLHKRKFHRALLRLRRRKTQS